MLSVLYISQTCVLVQYCILEGLRFIITTYVCGTVIELRLVADAVCQSVFSAGEM